jgi:hypothetical protein
MSRMRVDGAMHETGWLAAAFSKRSGGVRAVPGTVQHV